MSEISLHRELLDQGRTHFELERQVRSGVLSRIRRGAYAEPLPPGTGPTSTHRALLTAALRQLSDDAVVSHVSAAIILGLPTWSDQLARVHVTRNRVGGGRIERDLTVHGSLLGTADTTVVDGVRVTSLARTVVDISCTESIERGVAVGDAALRLGLRDDELRAAIDAARRRRGVGRARSVAGLVDVRSESVGESFSRVRFWRWGLPAPVLQVEVRDSYGRLVGRGDFGWPEVGTIGEFDGKVKYGALLKPGQTAQDVLLAEKRREERIRELGWQVVRWGWADLNDRSGLVARLEAAFGRGQDLSD